MKKAPIRIQIENPCHEKWDLMTPMEKGKFCENCKKQIIDYRSYSDKALISVIQSKKEPICGLFSSFQLNRPLVESYQYKSTSQMAYWGLSLIALTTTSLSFSHTQTEIQQLKNNHFDTFNTVANEDSLQSISDSTHYIFKGTVVDAETNDSIPFVSIIINGTEMRTISDINGKFTLSIPKEAYSDTLLVTFFSIEYSQVIEPITTLKNTPNTNEIKVELSSEELITLGIVVITDDDSKTKPKRRLFRRKKE